MGAHECDTCDRSFRSWNACKQHMTAVDHWIWEYECDTCTTHFNNAFSCNQHMSQKNHFSCDHKCETCPFAFRFENDRDDHQRAENHYQDRHCPSCDRYFQNAHNLSQHMKSRVHQGTKISCPFCKSAFTTASGISHHLESSACPSAPGLNRIAIYRTMRQRGTRGVITERLLEYNNGDDGEAHWSPASAWNGNFYKCYMCHREFYTSRSLSQHLSSGTHQAPLYHCPNTAFAEASVLPVWLACSTILKARAVAM